MEDLCNNLKSNPQVVCLYFAAVLVLLVLIIMQLWNVGWFQEATERFIADVGERSAFAAGMSAKFQPQFSGANQAPGSSFDTNQARMGEPLVSTRGEPDFWTNTDELGAYRRSNIGAPVGGSQGTGSAQVGQINAAAAVDAAAAEHAMGVRERMKSGWIGGNRLEHSEDPLMASLGGGSAYNA